VPLEGVDTVAGEAHLGVRVVEETRGLAEEFKAEVAIEIEFEVALAAVDADEAEGVAGVGRVGFVVA
jgi:hypothetical protein